MNIKHYITIAILLSGNILAQNTKPIQLSGTSSVKEFNIVASSELHKIKFGEDNIVQKVNTDTEGNFSASFNASKCGYYRLMRNHIYACPGDQITMNISEYANKAEFSGNNAELNNYLKNNTFPKAGSFLASTKNIKANIPLTIHTIDSLKTIRENELAALKAISPEIRQNEKARINADYINSILSIEAYYPLAHNITDESQLKTLKDELNTITSQPNSIPTELINSKYIHLPHYEQIIPFILEKANPNSPEYLKLKDWKNASDLSSKMQRTQDKKAIAEYYNNEIKSVKNPQYIKVLSSMKESLTSFGKGDIAKNFISKDAQGKSQSLEQFKGKVIYLDLWATWCQPCFKEMPYYDALQEKYAENKEIVFISLSIDENQASWKRNIDKRQAKGHQWITSRDILKDYNVIGVPRTIIIDQDFKIVEFQGPEPSSSQTEVILQRLLNIK